MDQQQQQYQRASLFNVTRLNTLGSAGGGSTTNSTGTALIASVSDGENITRHSNNNGSSSVSSMSGKSTLPSLSGTARGRLVDGGGGAGRGLSPSPSNTVGASSTSHGAHRRLTEHHRSPQPSLSALQQHVSGSAGTDANNSNSNSSNLSPPKRAIQSHYGSLYTLPTSSSTSASTSAFGLGGASTNHHHHTNHSGVATTMANTLFATHSNAPLPPANNNTIINTNGSGSHSHSPPARASTSLGHYGAAPSPASHHAPRASSSSYHQGGGGGASSSSSSPSAANNSNNGPTPCNRTPYNDGASSNNNGASSSSPHALGPITGVGGLGGAGSPSASGVQRRVSLRELSIGGLADSHSVGRIRSSSGSMRGGLLGLGGVVPASPLGAVEPAAAAAAAVFTSSVAGQQGHSPTHQLPVLRPLLPRGNSIVSTGSNANPNNNASGPYSPCTFEGGAHASSSLSPMSASNAATSSATTNTINHTANNNTNNTNDATTAAADNNNTHANVGNANAPRSPSSSGAANGLTTAARLLLAGGGGEGPPIAALAPPPPLLASPFGGGGARLSSSVGEFLGVGGGRGGGGGDGDSAENNGHRRPSDQSSVGGVNNTHGAPPSNLLYTACATFLQRPSTDAMQSMGDLLGGGEGAGSLGTNAGPVAVPPVAMAAASRKDSSSATNNTNTGTASCAGSIATDAFYDGSSRRVTVTALEDRIGGGGAMGFDRRRSSVVPHLALHHVLVCGSRNSNTVELGLSSQGGSDPLASNNTSSTNGATATTLVNTNSPAMTMSGGTAPLPALHSHSLAEDAQQARSPTSPMAPPPPATMLSSSTTNGDGQSQHQHEVKEGSSCLAAVVVGSTASTTPMALASSPLSLDDGSEVDGGGANIRVGDNFGMSATVAPLSRTLPNTTAVACANDTCMSSSTWCSSGGAPLPSSHHRHTNNHNGDHQRRQSTATTLAMMDGSMEERSYAASRETLRGHAGALGDSTSPPLSPTARAVSSNSVCGSNEGPDNNDGPSPRVTPITFASRPLSGAVSAGFAVVGGGNALSVQPPPGAVAINYDAIKATTTATAATIGLSTASVAAHNNNNTIIAKGSGAVMNTAEFGECVPSPAAGPMSFLSVTEEGGNSLVVAQWAAGITGGAPLLGDGGGVGFEGGLSHSHVNGNDALTTATSAAAAAGLPTNPNDVTQQYHSRAHSSSHDGWRAIPGGIHSHTAAAAHHQSAHSDGSAAAMRGISLLCPPTDGNGSVANPIQHSRTPTAGPSSAGRARDGSAQALTLLNTSSPNNHNNANSEQQHGAQQLEGGGGAVPIGSGHPSMSAGTLNMVGLSVRQYAQRLSIVSDGGGGGGVVGGGEGGGGVRSRAVSINGHHSSHYASAHSGGVSMGFDSSRRRSSIGIGIGGVGGGMGSMYVPYHHHHANGLGSGPLSISGGGPSAHAPLRAADVYAACKDTAPVGEVRAWLSVQDSAALAEEVIRLRVLAATYGGGYTSSNGSDHQLMVHAKAFTDLSSAMLVAPRPLSPGSYASPYQHLHQPSAPVTGMGFNSARSAAHSSSTIVSNGLAANVDALRGLVTVTNSNSGFYSHPRPHQGGVTPYAPAAEPVPNMALRFSTTMLGGGGGGGQRSRAGSTQMRASIVTTGGNAPNTSTTGITPSLSASYQRLPLQQQQQPSSGNLAGSVNSTTTGTTTITGTTATTSASVVTSPVMSSRSPHKALTYGVGGHGHPSAASHAAMVGGGGHSTASSAVPMPMPMAVSRALTVSNEEDDFFSDIRNYMVLDEIGKGQYGTVVRAVRPGVESHFAIKIIPKARLRRRFAPRKPSVNSVESVPLNPNLSSLPHHHHHAQPHSANQSTTSHPTPGSGALLPAFVAEGNGPLAMARVPDIVGGGATHNAMLVTPRSTTAGNVQGDAMHRGSTPSVMLNGIGLAAAVLVGCGAVDAVPSASAQSSSSASSPRGGGGGGAVGVTNSGSVGRSVSGGSRRAVGGGGTGMVESPRKTGSSPRKAGGEADGDEDDSDDDGQWDSSPNLAAQGNAVSLFCAADREAYSKVNGLAHTERLRAANAANAASTANGGEGVGGSGRGGSALGVAGSRKIKLSFSDYKSDHADETSSEAASDAEGLSPLSNRPLSHPRNVGNSILVSSINNGPPPPSHAHPQGNANTNSTALSSSIRDGRSTSLMSPTNAAGVGAYANATVHRRSTRSVQINEPAHHHSFENTTIPSNTGANAASAAAGGGGGGGPNNTGSSISGAPEHLPSSHPPSHRPSASSAVPASLVAIPQYSIQHLASAPPSFAQYTSSHHMHMHSSTAAGVSRQMSPSSTTAGTPRLLLYETTEALRQEVAVMKQLRHRNIVQLEEVIDDPEDEHVYIVMPFIEKGPIVELRDNRCKPLEVDLIKTYMRQILSAVSYLHRRQVVHCDIKPDNILLGADGVVYLVDFGVSEMFAPVGGMTVGGCGGLNNSSNANLHQQLSSGTMGGSTPSIDSSLNHHHHHNHHNHSHAMEEGGVGGGYHSPPSFASELVMGGSTYVIPPHNPILTAALQEGGGGGGALSTLTNPLGSSARSPRQSPRGGDGSATATVPAAARALATSGGGGGANSRHSLQFEHNFALYSTKCSPAFTSPESIDMGMGSGNYSGNSNSKGSHMGSQQHRFNGSKADMWSVGITMFILIFGRTPYTTCDSQYAVYQQISDPNGIAYNAPIPEGMREGARALVAHVGLKRRAAASSGAAKNANKEDLNSDDDDDDGVDVDDMMADILADIEQMCALQSAVYRLGLPIATATAVPSPRRRGENGGGGDGTHSGGGGFNHPLLRDHGLLTVEALDALGFTADHGLVRKYSAALALLTQLLDRDPTHRASARRALDHAFFGKSAFQQLKGLRQRANSTSTSHATTASTMSPPPASTAVA